jgi:uncharacterized protein YndB with AHSA1/START domain
MTKSIIKWDETRDLKLERLIPVKRMCVWKAWTDPDILMKWFCPKPWQVAQCRIDLRIGGGFFTRMQGPEGEDVPGEGCFLEVVEGYVLTFTDTMRSDFRPNENGFMTGSVQLLDHDGGTLYRAYAVHHSHDQQKKHLEMGFEAGWNGALDQMILEIQSW